MTDIPTPDHQAPSEEGANPAAMEAMANQVDSAWKMMLGQATAHGFTREDIITLTLRTAAVILGSTASALWPEMDTPEAERYARWTYSEHISTLTGDADEWQDRHGPAHPG